MIQPLKARAVVTRLTEPKEHSDLLLVPDSVGDKPSRFALVLAVGALREGGFGAGDVVFLRDYSGAACRDIVDGVEYECFIVEEKDVVARVEGFFQ